MELTGFRGFIENETVYSPDQITDVLKSIRPYFRFSYCNKTLRYFNVPCSFDIETSSFYRGTGNKQEKIAIMYGWTFGIFGAVIIGRTWDQFITMLNTLSDILKLNDETRLLVYVHNLSYEFQFMYKRFTWSKVFGIKNRTPVYALTTSGIEFRCSLLLSGYNLESLGNNLTVYPVHKMSGYLDYRQIRHSETPLSPDEIAYMRNDVRVVMSYIAERIERDGGIAYIPLTKTGYVRIYCRNSCFYEIDPNTGKPDRQNSGFKRKKYCDLVQGLKLDLAEYNQLHDAFQGGFTHANPFCYGKIQEDVTSFDFTSSYPAVMLSEEFPMSNAEYIDSSTMTKEEFYDNLKYYWCMFDVELSGLMTKLWQDNYISISRCWNVVNAQTNNGRVVRADRLMTTVTGEDWSIIRKFYEWKHVRITNFRRYKKSYLPTDFVKAIIKLYQDKTKLKNVAGREIDYMVAKELLNSCFGMLVTAILREEFPFTDHWLSNEEKASLIKTAEELINKYNNNRGRFSFYPWGVAITSYARRNLFTGIIEFGEDYIYSDTDSIKVKNADKHMDYIEKYNNRIREQLYRAMDYHGIERSAIEPETIDGEKKPLGVWDFDGHYSRFKTLGAKRYMVQYSDDSRNKKKDRGKVSITVSGLNKKTCIPFICDGWYYDLDGTEHNCPFDKFDRGLYVPPAYTGKLTHTYIVKAVSGYVTDYLGNPGTYYEESFVHLSESDYSLSLSEEYTSYLLTMGIIEY